ncbi:hypothetical protein QQX98_010704 [Neonectria punicea]|uniref:Uncharacterized protein n=1 Tax=Neonectria punicea TaxID=979145 RepID=A0ABR1GNP0_9HYPO
MATFSPSPSFHLCPDLSIVPPPNGHLHLGSVLRNLVIEGVLAPLDAGATVPIPASQLWPRGAPMEKMGFTRSIKELRSLEGSIWAKIFGWDGLGAIFPCLARREDDEVLTVDRLLVQYFTPDMEFVTRALEVDGVAFYIKNTKFKKPVFIITGLMWAEGASLSKVQCHEKSFSGQAAATEPKSGTTTGTSGTYRSQKNLITSFDGSTPFILGIRVKKIWWEKNVRREAYDVVGATLGDTEGNRTDVLDGIKVADDESDLVLGIPYVDESQLGGLGVIV